MLIHICYHLPDLSLTSNMNCMNLCCHSGKGLPCFTDCRQSLHIWTHSSLETLSSWNIKNNQHVERNTVYWVILAPMLRVLLLFVTWKRIRSVLNTPIESCVKKEIIWDFGIRPVLKSSADKEGERGEKKLGMNISLYRVCKYRYKKQFLHVHERRGI